jgi:DNA polymerase
MPRATKADLALEALAIEAQACRACDLWKRGTQTVFGDGPANARVALVGEQPGDEEDRTGEPFVGPAGRLLDDALEDAGLDRRRLYVTNAVKHFKWEARGKRRIHDKPNRTEVVACHQWLERELAVLRPDTVLVALGATAGQSLFGPKFRVGAARGSDLELDGRPVVATIHPSAILRARSSEERAESYADFVDDLRRAARLAS